VAEIFETQGEPAFRNLERVAVADACASPEPLVIACGGGAVLDPENRRVLRNAGTVVWLRAAPEVLSRRCGQGGAVRPLLAGSGSAPAAATLERLAGLRADTYDAASDAVVDTDDASLADVADAVVLIFEESMQ
jgi:shikimate kinase